MKYNYFITTESTCDPNELVQKFDMFKIIPMSYNFGDNIYYQGQKGDLTVPQFYEKLRKGELPSTAALSPYDITAAWEPILQDGYDILHVAFSSGLSATYSNLLLTAKELNEKYKERKIIVIDSLTASAGESMCAYKLLLERESGKSIDEVASISVSLMSYQSAYFTVDSLAHLFRLGRVSKAAATIGTFLHLKPCLHVNSEGKLIPIEKVSGRKASINWLFKKMDENIDLNKGNVVFIGNANATDEANELGYKIKDKYPGISVYHSSIGPVIGSHAGEKTIAIFFSSKLPK